MDKIIEKLEKELEQVEDQIAEKGLTKEKLDLVHELLETYNEVKKAKCYKKGEAFVEEKYEDYKKVDHNNYNKEDRFKSPYENNHHSRMRPCITRINDGADMYEEGKNRYQRGDTEQRMVDGLEKLMYGVCMLVENTVDFAETPQEKEVIWRHLRKLRDL